MVTNPWLAPCTHSGGALSYYVSLDADLNSPEYVFLSVCFNKWKNMVGFFVCLLGFLFWYSKGGDLLNKYRLLWGEGKSPKEQTPR